MSTWTYPHPEVDEDGENIWFPIVKLSHVIPWGYEQSEDDPDTLNPVPRELELLLIAKKYISQGHSIRRVANWLTTESGRPISHTGLSKRLKHEASQRNRISVYTHLSKKAEEYAEKAREIEQRQIGFKASGQGQVRKD